MRTGRVPSVSRDVQFMAVAPLNLRSPINFESGQPGAHRAAANAVETRAGCTRELLARRIIEMAERGERDPRRLVDDALLHFADLKAR